MRYAIDPKDGKESVSLTLLWITFILILGFSIASNLEYVQEPTVLKELFYSCLALYFGRRVSFDTLKKTITLNKDKK